MSGRLIAAPAMQGAKGMRDPGSPNSAFRIPHSALFQADGLLGLLHDVLHRHAHDLAQVGHLAHLAEAVGHADAADGELLLGQGLQDGGAQAADHVVVLHGEHRACLPGGGDHGIGVDGLDGVHVHDLGLDPLLAQDLGGVQAVLGHHAGDEDRQVPALTQGVRLEELELVPLGEDDGLAYFDALNPNIKEYTTSGSAPAKAAVRGDVAIAYGLLWQCVNYANENEDLTVVVPDQGLAFDLFTMGMISGHETKASVREVFTYLYDELNKPQCAKFNPDTIYVDMPAPEIPNYPEGYDEITMAGLFDFEYKQNLLDLWMY